MQRAARELDGVALEPGVGPALGEQQLLVGAPAAADRRHVALAEQHELLAPLAARMLAPSLAPQRRAARSAPL
eukprot:6879929-Prymnesium_polylepis.1